MPKLVRMIPETIESVTRPVIFDITRELFALTGIDPKTRIFYPGDNDTGPQMGSMLSAQDPTPDMGHNAKVTVRAEENFDEERVLATAVYQPENRFIFRDDAIESYLKPAYAPVDVTLEFRYRASDRTAALKWRDEIKTKVSMGAAEHLHTLKYHYLLPEELLVVLKELHRMREAVAGYGEDWDTYFQRLVTSRASELTNQAGARKVWAISESVVRVLGWFNFEAAPERGERDGDGEAWSITFSYRFKYEKPIACVMGYPLVVHNQVVGKDFRPSKADQPERTEAHPRSYSLSTRSFSLFEQGRWDTNQAVATAPGFVLPSYDEFIPHGVVPRTLRLFTALTTVDTAEAGDPQLLLDLTQLSTGFALDPLVLQYMQAIYAKMRYPNQSPFLLSLYRNRDLLSGDHLEVTPELLVRSTQPLSLRDYWHVRLGLNTDWRSIVDKTTLDLLRENATLLMKLLTAIDSRVTLKGVLSNGYVPRASLQAAIDQLDEFELASGNRQIYQFNTVSSMFVVANRKD